MKSRRESIAVYLGLLILTLATYWPVMGFGFINFDDPSFISGNTHVQSGLTLENVRWAFTTGYFSSWHPLTWLSLMLDFQLFGSDPHAFHAVNLLFHAANALLLLFILQQLTGDLWRSAIVAALFALHPLHVESVVWIAERKDVLSTFFELLTILAYIGYVRKRTVSKYITIMVLFVFGLMAKPMLVTLPVALLLMDFWPLKRFSNLSTRLLVSEKVPLLILALVASGITIWVQHLGNSLESFEHMPVGARVANAAFSYMVYLAKVFWPSRLAVFYPWQPVPLPETLFACALFVPITWVAVTKAKLYPYFFFGWFWFLIMLLPTIGLIQVGEFARADRYTYVPIIGLFVILVWGYSEIVIASKWPGATSAVVILILLSCAFMTRCQIGYWKDSESLFRHALDVTYNNWLAEHHLAESLLDAGKLEEANQHARRGMQIRPTIGLCLTLADIDCKLGKQSEAIQYYRAVLRFDPNRAELLNNLAWMLATNPDEAVRNGPEAVALAEKACQLTHFKRPVLIGTLAAAYAEAGRFEDAVATAQQACDIAAADGLSEVLKKNQELLKIYRSGHTYLNSTLQ